ADMPRASPLLKLLGDQMRLTMMKLLQARDCCVREFVEIFTTSQPPISQHLRQLRDIGWRKGTRTGRWSLYSMHEDHDDYPFIQGMLEHLRGQDGLVTELEAQGLRICCE